MQAPKDGDEVDECEWESGRLDVPAHGDSDWVNLDEEISGSAEELSQESEKRQVGETGAQEVDAGVSISEFTALKVRLEALEKENGELRKQAERSANQADHYASLAGSKEKELVRLQEQVSEQAQAKSAGVDAMLEEMAAREELWKKSAGSKIAYTSFEAGDLALFLPTSSGHFIAFNKGCPFRFLSPESLSAAEVAAGNKVEYVLGQVVEICECVVLDDASENIFGLPPNTTYYVCTVSVQ